MLTVIGEALIDEVVRPGADTQAHVGGSPLNVAVGLARLGHATRFFGSYGADEYGRRISEYLKANSVLTMSEAEARATSVARAELAADGSAEYTFDLDWDVPGLSDADVADSSLVHSGSIASMLSPGAEHVYSALLSARGHATISYDPNYRPSIITDRAEAVHYAERFVGISDVVKASDEDLVALYPDRSPEDSARAWLELGPAIVVITRGGEGPWGLCRAGEVDGSAPQTQVVDTVGAGDSFMAALLGALVDRRLDGQAHRNDLASLSTATLEQILKEAAAAAAITVSRAGANPPSRAELQAAQQ